METPTGVVLGRKGVGHAGLKKSAVQGNGTVTNQKRKGPIKAKSSRCGSLVADYYPAVYSFASRLTDDPWEAVVVTRDAFESTRKQVRNRRDEVALASILIAAVIRRVLPPLKLKLTQCLPMRDEQNLKRLQQRRRTFHYVQQCY